MSDDGARIAEERAAAFWQFSYELYTEPDIEAHLISLQDRDGLEVNLALFCLFAASRGQLFDYTTIEAMRGVGLAWGHEVVGHLRQARRLMKPRAETNEDVARLRKEVKAIELAAEQAMQGALCTLLAEPAEPDAHAARAMAAQNFAAWFDEEGIDGEAPRAAVAHLIAAAFPD